MNMITSFMGHEIATAYQISTHTFWNSIRNEIDDSQELNYPAIMRAIAATNYDGYVGQEFSPVKDASISLEMAYRICDV